MQRAVLRQALAAALLALFGALLAALVRRSLVGARPALALLSAVMAGDLARAGAGINPQAPPAVLAPLPELAAQRLDALDGGRVFSYGLDESPAFRRFLAGGASGRGLWSFFLSRQMLVPYTSVLDGIETAHGKDLTSFVPRAPELEAGELDPARAGAILPRLRAAAVTRVLSLDPLEHPDLLLRSRLPAGPPDTWIHVYALGAAAPRREVVCSAPRGEESAPAGCASGTVRALRLDPAAQEFEVEADGPGALLLRDTHARGWRAWMDGEPAALRRAGDKHRAVPVPAGRHRVRLVYTPPGLRLGLVVMAASLAAAAALARKPLV